MPGKLLFLKTLHQNDFVRTNDTLFAVIPSPRSVSSQTAPFRSVRTQTEGTPLIGLVTIGVEGLGKVRVGQRVVVRLDDYPYAQFGVLQGTVSQLAPSTNRQQYRIRVDLPHGLRTTSGSVPLPFRPEMTGTAELVTDDLRMMERAFYGLRSLIR